MDVLNMYSFALLHQWLLIYQESMYLKNTKVVIQSFYLVFAAHPICFLPVGERWKQCEPLSRGRHCLLCLCQILLLVVCSMTGVN